jgi:hypothetical protein
VTVDQLPDRQPPVGTRSVGKAALPGQSGRDRQAGTAPRLPGGQ